MASFLKNKSFGFTLAEVLITLGIIGVVAAITIPTLMQNIQDKQFRGAAKNAFSKAAQAVNKMKADNDGTLRGYYDTSCSFKPDFSKYFKVAQDCGGCGLPLCVDGDSISTVYRNLSGGQTQTWWMNQGQFITIDGMFWAIGNAGSGYGSLIEITVDVNGYGNKPNILGKDVFAFQVLNDRILPMGAAGTQFDSTASNYYCNKATGDWYDGLGCMMNVMQGIDY